MGSFAVVVVDPWLQVSVSLLRVGPVFGVGPFAQGGLDEALGLAVGSGRVGSGAAVFDAACSGKLAEQVVSGSWSRCRSAGRARRCRGVAKNSTAECRKPMVVSAF